MKNYRKPAYREDLTALRDQSGLTQNQLADALGISRSAWQKYEYGQRNPSPAVLDRITVLKAKFAARQHEGRKLCSKPTFPSKNGKYSIACTGL